MPSDPKIIKLRQPGWSLAQPYYTDPGIFQMDMERVFAGAWLFAGHACQVRNRGEFFCYQIGNDSLIIIRGHDNRIRALFNVCRHRGSIICKQPAGQLKLLVCPYHQWSYDIAGKLLRNTWMPDDFNRDEFSLHQAHLRNVAGLIFVSLAPSEPTFEAEDELRRLIEPHGLENARIAYSETYDLKANWKLVIENQRECYHCPNSHKGYAAIQYDTDVDDEDKREHIEARRNQARTKWAALGLDVSLVSSRYAMSGPWWRANRTPFREGFVSETVDGQPVAPLMGQFTDPDVGNARANTYPNFWLHGSCDHMHTMRVTPVDATTTRITAVWLVAGDAREDIDYDVESLIAFSKRVNDEDREIVETQAQGIASSRYRPGPYSPVKEKLVAHFVDWYLDQVAD